MRRRLGRNTKIQDTLTTDTNERSKTNFTKKANDACLFTMDATDTMKDGQDKKHEDPKQILRRKRMTRVYDGCERYDGQKACRARSTKIQDTLTTVQSNTNFTTKANDRQVFTTDANDTMKDGEEARRSKTR